MEEGALRGGRRVDKAERTHRLRKPAMGVRMDERGVEHEIADALARNPEVLRERPCKNRVLVDVERLELVDWGGR